MTSLVVPVMANGIFLGIAGADVDMEDLQAYLKTHNPFPGNADINLITYHGMIAASDGNYEHVGAHMRKIHQKLAGGTWNIFSQEKQSLN